MNFENRDKLTILGTGVGIVTFIGGFLGGGVLVTPLVIPSVGFIFYLGGLLIDFFNTGRST